MPLAKRVLPMPILWERTFAPEVRRWGMVSSPNSIREKEAGPFLVCESYLAIVMGGNAMIFWMDFEKKFAGGTWLGLGGGTGGDPGGYRVGGGLSCRRLRYGFPLGRWWVSVPVVIQGATVWARGWRAGADATGSRGLSCVP